MAYQVQKGDTIEKVTNLLNVNWKTLQRLNPHAVGQSSKTGRWFLKEGVVIRGEQDFKDILGGKRERNDATSSSRNGCDDDWVEYTIKPGDNLWTLAVKRFHVHVEDLIRDNSIMDPNRLVPGQKIRVRMRQYPQKIEVVASWYGKNHHGRPMANGEFFNMYGDTIAHKNLPFGTRVELENPLTGQRAKAIVTDRGPYVPGRDVDLSYGLARKLSIEKKGIGKLTMRIV